MEVESTLDYLLFFFKIMGEQSEGFQALFNVYTGQKLIKDIIEDFKAVAEPETVLIKDFWAEAKKRPGTQRFLQSLQTMGDLTFDEFEKHVKGEVPTTMKMKYGGNYDDFVSGDAADEHILMISGQFDCDPDKIQITVSPGSVVIEYVFEENIENKIAEKLISGSFDVGMPVIDAALPGIPPLIEGGALTESALTWEPKPNMFATVSESVDVIATLEATAA